MRWAVPGFPSPYRACGVGGGEKERDGKVSGKEEAVRNTFSLHRGNSCFLTRELPAAPEDAEWKSTSWDVQWVPRQRLPVSPARQRTSGERRRGSERYAAKPDSDLKHPDS